MVINLKIVGTIVEYNPLHNGHAYAISKIKEESKADVVIAVMSGDFTMRGELSLFNKFEKTHQALNIGIDMVIELPFPYTVQNSDLFSEYAIKLLNLCKVNEVWFGSESNNSILYEKYYNAWKDEANQHKIKELINTGMSYKMATSTIINLPSNDLLGFSYYKAIKDNNFNMTVHTIQRVGSGYLDETPNIFASAYSIRKDKNLINEYCPSFINQDNIRDNNKLFNHLKYQILNLDTTDLKNIFLVEEGIENKLKDIYKYNNLKDFVNYLISKRYTRSRIQRILLYVLFNINKDLINNIKSNEPNFIRVLGYTDNGLAYLKQIKKDVSIYTNIKNNINDILDITIKISKILDLIYNQDLLSLEQNKPIHIKNSEN